MSDATIANVFTALVTITTMVIGFLTLWVRLKYGIEQVEQVNVKTTTVESKLDDNTAITREGSAQATKNAATAATAATAAKVAVAVVAQSLDRKLNGGVDNAIEIAIRPLREALDAHVVQHEADMREIRSRLAGLPPSGGGNSHL